MSTRHAALLAELAEIGMLCARELRADVEGDDPAAKARAIADFPKIARAVRQTLALEARFARDAQRAEHEAVQAAERERDAARQRTRTQVRTRVERAIYAAEDDDDLLDLRLEDLRDCLHDDIADPGLFDLPVETIVARIRHDLGLDPSDEDEDDDEDHEEEDEAPPGPPCRPGPDDLTFDACPDPHSSA